MKNNNLDSSKYSLVCGMEVHAELKTKSKMFCGCTNNPFHAKQPNSHTCPVCLGHPGGIPVANKTAIEWTIKLGLALNCEVNLFSKFDRKHYFYPDLAKGYQISQYDLPFCENGYLDTSEGRVRITRIHLEEDTAKLQHKSVDGKKVSLVDFNRSGVPLIEIVTEPDIKSGNQAKEYGRKLREIIRYLDIGDCDMEQGGMRLEANISITTDPNKLPDYKVEVKNINSFRFVEQAINFEMKRHAQLLDAGETPVQETRGWNPTKSESFSQRSKESAEDYRYLPDPDIPPIRFEEGQIESWKNDLPLLPEEVLEKWEKEFGVESRFTNLLFSNATQVKWLTDLFELAKSNKVDPNQIAKDMANKNVVVEWEKSSQEFLDNYISKTKVDEIDTSKLSTVIAKVIQENPSEHSRYQAGETKLLNFFVGQTMRELKAKVDMGQLMPILKQELNK